MDRGGASAATLPHDMSSLPGEGGKQHFAIGVFRHMACQGGFAGSGIAEQAKHLRCAILEPGTDILQCLVLLR